MRERFLIMGHGRAFILSLLIAAALSGPALAAVDGAGPPRSLHKVGDHWTAWDPPAPSAGVEIYVIVRGDTLWDLAKRFNGNPYLWPQLWEKNQYIKDAHWIYPGDPLVTGIEVVPAESVGAAASAPAAESEAPGPEPVEGTKEPEAPSLMRNLKEAAPGTPSPLGSESDIYCSGFIGGLDETFGYHVIGSEYQTRAPSLWAGRRGVATGVWGEIETVKYGLDMGDILYVDGGEAAGLSPGSLFSAVAPGDVVKHPYGGQVVGRYYHYLGRLRILSVQEKSAIAEIVQSCDPINVGVGLRPFEEEPVPLGRAGASRPVNEPASAASLAQAPVILLAPLGNISLGEDSVVVIDRGGEEKVSPGDVFSIYRLNREGFPPSVIGELAVLSVRDHSALAKILRSAAPAFVGDRLERK